MTNAANSFASGWSFSPEQAKDACAVASPRTLSRVLDVQSRRRLLRSLWSHQRFRPPREMRLMPQGSMVLARDDWQLAVAGFQGAIPDDMGLVLCALSATLSGLEHVWGKFR